jgi:molecular chaperone DnaK
MNTAWTAASEEMYKSTQEGGAQPNAQQGANGDGAQTADAGANDNVTDVPYEEVK